MKPQIPTNQRRFSRAAVTVLEVLFATVVVVVGLIGIASVIPVAARNAQEATAHTNALNLGLGWADSFFARGLHRPSPNLTQGQMSWIWYRDYDVNNSGGPGWENLVRAGYTQNANDRNRVNSSILPFDSPSFSTAGINSDPSRRIWARLPVCIDPYFMTSESMTSRIGSGSTRVGAYRASVFPYFNDRYDPAVDPFAAPTLTVDQPRMLRVSLAFSEDTNPYRRGRPASRNLISGIIGSTDELQVDDYVDPSLPAVDRNSQPASRFFARSANGSPLRSLTEGRYTWMATVVPVEPTPSDLAPSSPSESPFPSRRSDLFARRLAESFLVSFVVLSRHSHEYIAANASPLPGDSESQPTGERLVRVYPMSGNFQGGTGGRVRLIANETVSSKLTVGDWIMLGRYYLFDTPDGSRPWRRPYPYFRWYRIIGTSGEPEYGTLGSLRPPQFAYVGDPVGAPVWARDLVLEGPDFAFYEDPNTTPLTPIPTPTLGTLVSGVVTVIERQVSLQ